MIDFDKSKKGKLADLEREKVDKVKRLEIEKLQRGVKPRKLKKPKVVKQVIDKLREAEAKKLEKIKAGKVERIELEEKKQIEFDESTGHKSNIAVLLALEGEIIIDLALKKIIVPHWTDIGELKVILKKVESGVGEF
jgi:hypothetical protein